MPLFDYRRELSSSALISCDTVDHVVQGGLAIRVRSVERNVPVLLFITRYKVVARLKSVDEILNCDHSLIAVVQEVPVPPPPPSVY